MNEDNDLVAQVAARLQGHGHCHRYIPGQRRCMNYAEDPQRCPALSLSPPNQLDVDCDCCSRCRRECARHAG